MVKVRAGPTPPLTLWLSPHHLPIPPLLPAPAPVPTQHRPVPALAPRDSGGRPRGIRGRSSGSSCRPPSSTGRPSARCRQGTTRTAGSRAARAGPAGPVGADRPRPRFPTRPQQQGRGQALRKPPLRATSAPSPTPRRPGRTVLPVADLSASAAAVLVPALRAVPTAGLWGCIPPPVGPYPTCPTAGCPPPRPSWPRVTPA